MIGYLRIKIPFKTTWINMHHLRKDWLGAFVVAGLGAGVITSLAVSQGQNPLVGLGITAFSATVAVLIDHVA